MWFSASVFLLSCLLALSHGSSSSCPKECSCSSQLKRVSCEGKELSHPPDGIPVEVTELYLGRNKFTTLTPNFLAQDLPNLKILSLVQNYISDVQSKAFSNLGSLETLYLTNNHISKLPNGSLEGLDSLSKLYLSQNKLTAVPDLSLTPNMTKLWLDTNKLSSAKFPKRSPSPRKLISITLAHNPINSLSSDDFEVLKGNPIATFNLNNCQLKSVENGTFSPFTKLQSLSLANNQFKDESDLLNIISSLSGSSLQSLDLSSSLSSLPRNVFEPLRSHDNFRTLTLRNCSMVALLNGTFAPLSSLYFLDFSYSKIAKVEPGTFEPLLSLRQLYLGNTPIENLPIPFPPNLEALDLSNDKSLTEIPKNSFPAGLITLKMPSCSLRQINKGAFTGLSNLLSLDLSSNKLADTAIPKDAFVDMGALSSLDLSGNLLKRITTSVRIFNGLKSLKTLNMSMNDCSQLPGAVFDPLVELQVLDLRSNYLGSFLSNDGNPLFSNLHQLQSLNLVENDIPVITESIFQGLRNISKLYLSHNRITHWAPTAFKENKNLTYLDLSTNSISVINSTSVEHFTAKTLLSLNNNPFYCWCDLVWFRNWLNSTSVRFQNLASYTCSSPHEFAQSPLLQFDPLSINTACHPPYKWVALGVGVIVFIIVTVLAIVLYRIRWKIFLCWYKRRCCGCCRGDISDEEKPLLQQGDTFNATILYGPDDASVDWVKDEFYPYVKDTLGLVAFMEDEHILLGSGYSEQIGKTNNALSTSNYIFIIMSGEFVGNGRRYFEMDLTIEWFDKRRATNPENPVHIIPIMFPDGSNKTEARIRVAINKLFKTRCKDENVLFWSQDNEEAQNLFWEKLQTNARQLGIIR